MYRAKLINPYKNNLVISIKADTLEALLFYWIKEYDYTLEAHFDGGYWLQDFQTQRRAHYI